MAIIWEGHKAGREIPYCHMEKLCNLEQLPHHGFVVAGFHFVRETRFGWLDVRGGALRLAFQPDDGDRRRASFDCKVHAFSIARPAAAYCRRPLPI